MDTVKHEPQPQTLCGAGVYIDMAYLTEERTTLQYEMPLAEVVTDFFDEMKSRSKGYASMDYQFLEYRENDLVKLEIRINGELAEPLATICHRCATYQWYHHLLPAVTKSE